MLRNRFVDLWFSGRGIGELTQRSSGLLEQVVQREGLTPPEPVCRGRAGRRLAHSLAVARWLRTLRAPADLEL